MMRAAIWQPMATAPRDGTIVDLHLTGGGRYADAWWEEEDGTWCGLEESMFNAWAPLPVHPIQSPHDAMRVYIWSAIFFIALAVLVIIGSLK